MNRPRRLLTVGLPAMLVFCAIIAVGSDDAPVFLPDNPLAAARIFESKQCVRCHLIDFQHEGYGPDLGRINLSNNMYDIVGRMWNSAPDMVSKMESVKIEFPSLTAVELGNLLAYLGVYQNYLVHYSRPVDMKNGKRLYEEKKCGSCHSFDPEANTTGPSLSRFRGSGSPQSVVRAMWLHSYYMRKAGARMGIDWPKFKNGEIKDLLAYVVGGELNGDAQPRYLRPGSPQTGKQLFTAYDCDKCHSVKGKGATEAPDLGNILNNRNIDIYVILEAFWNHSPAMWETLRRERKPGPQLSTSDFADIVAYLFFVNFDRTSGNIQDGQRLFEDRSCSACHDATDVSGGSLELLSRFWNNVPEMLAEAQQEGIEWPILSEGEVSSLIEYLASVSKESSAKEK